MQLLLTLVWLAGAWASMAGDVTKVEGTCEAKGESCESFLEGGGAASVQVQLAQGVVEGQRQLAGKDRYFYSFKTIPYAEPPVGPLRFKDPLPAGEWTGVRNGSLETPTCPQEDFMAFMAGEVSVTGQEDCLFLSVYTPKPYAADLPVMVWIHGGGFNGGGVEWYGPLPYMTRDVVLVTIQYRLNTLGFLTTEDSVLGGNMGLKDQVVALRWVQDNIRSLGGDPNKVTIFGESAGGASVDLLILSPMAKGLFQRAIVQSGTALAPWTIKRGYTGVAKEIGRFCECPSDLDSNELLECLRKAPMDELVLAYKKFEVFNMAPFVIGPCVDGEFLPDHPAVLLRDHRYNSDVDVIAGMMRDDGALFHMLTFSNPNITTPLFDNWDVNGPLTLLVDKEENPAYLASRMFLHYADDLNITGNDNEVVKLLTDFMFRVDLLETAEHHLKDSGRYFLYSFDHLPEDQILDAGHQWVNHGSELAFQFSSLNDVFGKTMTNKVDLVVQHILLELWTNFAITGHPTPDLSLGFKWTPASASDFSHLAITSTPSMKPVDMGQMEFWRNLPLYRNKLLYPERFVPEA